MGRGGSNSSGSCSGGGRRFSGGSGRGIGGHDIKRLSRIGSGMGMTKTFTIQQIPNENSSPHNNSLNQGSSIQTHALRKMMNKDKDVDKIFIFIHKR